jgi:hypothetical protein
MTRSQIRNPEKLADTNNFDIIAKIWFIGGSNLD